MWLVVVDYGDVRERRRYRVIDGVKYNRGSVVTSSVIVITILNEFGVA